MANDSACRSCGVPRRGVSLPIVEADTLVTWCLCPRCWMLLRAGWAEFFPGWPLDTFLDPEAPPYWTVDHVQQFIAEGGRELTRGAFAAQITEARAADRRRSADAEPVPGRSEGIARQTAPARGERTSGRVPSIAGAADTDNRMRRT